MAIEDIFPWINMEGIALKKNQELRIEDSFVESVSYLEKELSWTWQPW